MQAGDKLKFIDGSDSTQRPPLTDEHYVAARAFLHEICEVLFTRFDTQLRSKTYGTDSDTLVITELPLRLAADDGSYLHVVIFCDDSGNNDVTYNVSIFEHAESGSYIRGHIYLEGSDDTLTRTDLPPELGEEGKNVGWHFSALEFYDGVEEQAERMAAGEYTEEIDDEESFEDVDNELEGLMLEKAAVRLEELYGMAEVLMDVEVFA